MVTTKRGFSFWKSSGVVGIQNKDKDIDKHMNKRMMKGGKDGKEI